MHPRRHGSVVVGRVRPHDAQLADPGTRAGEHVVDPPDGEAGPQRAGTRIGRVTEGEERIQRSDPLVEVPEDDHRRVEARRQSGERIGLELQRPAPLREVGRHHAHSTIAGDDRDSSLLPGCARQRLDRRVEGAA